MLDFLRRRKRSWIITFLLALIIIVFVAFYGGSNYRDSGVQHVARVNDEAITEREFMIEYQRALERYREMFKGSLTPEMLKSLNIKRNLIEGMIEKRLLLQEARALGLTVTDDELANVLSLAPEFHVAGRFNKERYVQLLRANKLTPAEFEEEQRAQLTIQRLYGSVLDPIHVSEDQVRERYRLEHERINVLFIRLPAKPFLAEAQVTEEEVTKFYERNKEDLKQPLKIQLEYLSYEFDQFVSSHPIPEKEIAAYYEANRDTRFRKPKEAKVRYIGLRLDPQAGPEENSKVRQRAKQIIADARSGKDFAQLAKKESDDPTSATGGDVGWLVEGQLPPQLEKEVFSLSPGQVSDPIETPAGIQIVKVEEVREAKTLTLKEATAEIVRTLRSDRAKRAAAEAADRGREAILSGSDPGKAAQESRGSLRSTGLISEGGVIPEIGAAPDFYKSVFALKTGEISPVLEGTTAYYVARVTQRVEPAVPPLDSVRSEIEKRLTESKAQELMLQKANALLEQLRKETPIAKVAQQNGLKVEETGWFTRNAAEIPRVGELPDLRSGGLLLSEQRPVAEKVYTHNDGAYLFALKEAQPADMERFARDKDALIKAAEAEARQRVAQKYMEALKAKADIQFNPDAFEEA